MSAWNFSCPDWADRLQRGESIIPDLPLDEDQVARAVRAFNNLRVPDLVGTPTLEEAGADWQREIVAAIFGSLDEAGRRRVREVFLMVPKKNYKTGLGAAIMLLGILFNVRKRAEFYIVGPTQKVADTAFQTVKGMIEEDEILSSKLHVNDSELKITHRVTKATLEVVTFSVNVLTGKKPAGVLIDEVHLLGAIKNADRVLGQLRGGQDPFPDAFLVEITTQSEERPAGVFATELAQAREIRDGKAKFQSSLLPVLYEFPLEMQSDPAQKWKDPATWPLVTPNLGRSQTIERLAEAASRAQASGEAEWRRWASQHLNIQIGVALHAERWAAAEDWERAGNRALTLDAMFQRCEVLVAGVDGGGRDDLFGLSVAGRERGSSRWLFWFHAWAMPIVLERRKGIAPALLDFEREGSLTFVNTLDEAVGSIGAIGLRLVESGLIPERDAVGFDQVLAGQVFDALLEAGFDEEQCRLINTQAWSMSSAIRTMEHFLADSLIEHDGSELMKWCVGNAKAQVKKNSVFITKEIAGSSKIDPLIAGFNAAKLLEHRPVAKPPKAKGSIYFIA